METKYFDVKVRCQTKETPEKPERLSFGTVLTLGVWVLVLVMLIACMTVGAYRRYEPSQRMPAGETAAPVNDSAAELWVAEADPGAETSEETVAKLIAEAQVVDRPPNPWGVPLFDSELAAMYKACEENHLSPELALGLMDVETGGTFDRNVVAKSGSGCYGLCQLNPKYFPTELSPEDNIRYGLNYLGACMERYDNLEAGLCSYHDGHDSGRRDYSNAVIAKMKYYGGMFGE